MRVLFVFRGGEWLGIEYLSAYLKKAGYVVELAYHPGSAEVERRLKSADWFHRALGMEEKMIRFAEKFEPDIIAFSSPTNLFPWTKKMAGLLKKALKVPIIIGGPHATSVPEYVIENPEFDMVCVGEGEEAFLELLKAMEKRSRKEDIKNIWFKKNGEIRKNPVRPLIENLDSLPFPDKSIFEKYGAVNRRLYIMTARGCPFSCSYCYTSMLRSVYNGSPLYRRRSVENVMEEIEFHFHRKKYKEVYFYDDIFTLDKKWLEDFARVYSREVRVPFKALVHPTVVDRERALLLKKAGCYYVDIGVESGNERVRRDILNRQVSNKSIQRAIEILKEVGIKVCTLNIFGIPGETEDEMWETVKVNLELKPDGAITSVMYPFPNTGIYHYCVERGYLSDEDVRSVMKGLGSYKERTFIKSSMRPSKTYRYMRLLPVLVKFKIPPSISKFLLKLPMPSFVELISIPFTSIFPNFWFRFKEFVMSNIRSILFYSRDHDGYRHQDGRES